MVTYECDFRELIKASVMMTLAKLPMSVFLTALTGALTVLLMGALSNPLAGLIIYSVIGLTFLRYPLEFYASRVIEKNIKAVKKKEKKKKAKITYMEEA
jgi:uncharacterized membrane protein YesL